MDGVAPDTKKRIFKAGGNRNDNYGSMQKIRKQAHRMDYGKRASSGVLFAALHKPLVSHTDSMCFICAAPVTLLSQLRPFSGNNPHMFARIKSLSRQIIHLTIQEIGGSSYMKATGIVRRIDDLGRVVIPKEIRRTLRIREGDPLQMTLARWERFCFAMEDLTKRMGWSSYIVTKDVGGTVGIQKG